LEEVALSGTNQAFPDDMPLMQYTGLKDKNGVEIYEGDVVNIIDPHVETWGEVVYWEHDASFGVMGSGTFRELLSSAHRSERELEVIGNIYENPELLGDTQS